MRGGVILLAAALLVRLGGPALADPCCGPITPAGQRLIRFLDTSGVDHLWQPGQHVNWETGAATSPGKASSTHCSAYAASMAERLGIYLLRPPQHSEILLANAQFAWMRDTGAGSGWRSLPDPPRAQAAANRGELVLEVFESPNPTRPGHIAIVRPSEQTREDLDRDGPRETQAGATNALDISTREGFRHHKGAWQREGHGTIRYYAHPVNWAALP